MQSNRFLGLLLTVSFLILFFQWPWQFSFELKHYRLPIIINPFPACKEPLWMSIYPIVQRIQKTTLPSMRSILLTGFAFSTAIFFQNNAVDQFVATQYPISKAGVLANIGPSGSKSSSAKVRFCFTPTLLVFKWIQAGVVIASPSISDPDYLYTWARDSALVYKTIIHL